MKVNLFGGFLLACVLLFSSAAHAAPQPQIITGDVEGFASAVATDGNVAVVGAVLESVNGNERQGAAYVYELQDGQWQQVARLTASDGEALDRFGEEVAVDSDVIVVSAWHADPEGVDSAGKAYVFERNDAGEWLQTARLAADEPSQGALFGYSIAVDGNRIAVSSPNQGRTYRYSGGAEYVFEQDPASENWQQVARLERERTPGTTDGTQSIAISGDLLAIGTAAGTAFIWEYDGGAWVEDHAVDLGRARAYVSLEGDVFAAAMPADVWPEINGTYVGRVHVHERNAAGVWKETAILESITPAPDKAFGAEFSMQDGIIVASTGHRAEAIVSSFFRKNENGDWIRFHELDGYLAPMQGDSNQLDVSARALVTVSRDEQTAINIFETSEFIASPNVDNPSAGVREGDPAKYTGDGTNNTFASVIPYSPQYLERSDTPRPDGEDNSNFGRSMDAEENLLVIGAPNANSAYVFEHDGEAWQEVARLVQPGNATGLFGTAVRLAGDYIAVSAPRETVDGTAEAGAIHVYRREEGTTQWTHVSRLVMQNPVEGARLGWKMDFDADHVVANVPGDNRHAHLFTRGAQDDSWSVSSPFVGEDGTQISAGAIAVSDGVVALGDRSGPVSIYENSSGGWVMHQQLPAAYVGDIAIDNGLMVVGFPRKSVDERGRGEGVAEVYQRGSVQWNRVATLQAVSPDANNAFGVRVDVEDGLIVVTENHESGGTYLFGQNDAGEWIFFDDVYMGTGHGLSHEATVSALSLVVSIFGLADVGVAHAYDIEQLAPEDYALAGGGDDGDSSGDGGDTGGNSDDETGGGDDSTGGDTGGGGDSDIGGGDEEQTVTGGDDDDEGAGGEEGEDDSGDAGDDGDDGDDGDETGGSGGGGDDTAAEDPPETGGGGGGALGWLAVLMLPFATAIRRRRT